MHDQWEYKTLQPVGMWFNDYQDLQGVSYGSFSEEMLNKLGKDGWEYCSIIGNLLTFKRRII